MKNITFSFLAAMAVASTTFAGQEMAPSKGVVPPADPCFKDQELQIDLFGTYNDSTQRSRYSDTFGGGVAVNYFFHRYFGIGIEGNVFDGNTNGVWQLGGRLIGRYPLELGGICIAPYAFGGGGIQMDGLNGGTYVAGGGLEWRATPAFGVFGEGRYTWACGDTDSGQARFGVRFVF